ncbi:MAG TPA: hypothetical protein PLY55_05545, partial [Saprospiraceae bacterium]|nr:hypothetical protein [Saprospiraceae bacterium]
MVNLNYQAATVHFIRTKCRVVEINVMLKLKCRAAFLIINTRIKKKVEVIGVEPTTSCMPCKRSSQL